MADSVDLSQLGSGMSDLAGRLGDGISLSDASISQLGTSISSALTGALSALLPRMMEYASGILTNISGVGTYSDAAFMRSMSAGSPFGLANTAAAMGSGMLDKQGYIIQYANSLGFNTTDYAEAEQFLKSSGQFRRADELAYAASNKGRSGGLDPNAARTDASFTSKMQLFNESIASARNEAANGQFKDLFKGMDVSTMKYADIQSVIKKENEKLDGIITDESRSKDEREAAKRRQEDLNNNQLVAAIGDAEQFGNLNPMKGMTPENEARVAQLTSMRMSQAIFNPGAAVMSEDDVKKQLSESSLASARLLANEELGDLFKGKDVDRMSAKDMQRVIVDEITRISNDDSLSNDEARSQMSKLRHSRTMENLRDSRDFENSMEDMSTDNAALVKSIVSSPISMTPGERDALRRQELAGGFGMLVNEAALGVEGNGYTDPKKEVAAMQKFVMAAGGVDQARQLAVNWAGSDQFDKDIDLAFAGNEERKNELLEKLGSGDSKEAESARAELFKAVMDYTSQEGNGDMTGLGRAVGLQQQAMAATGGNAAEAQNILNVLSAAYGVTSREGVTEELASGGSRVLEYLRKTAENGEVFIEKMGQVKQSLDDLGIASTDINGNPNKLTAQLTAASLGVDLGMRNAGVGDTAVASAAANEFARDLAGSRESQTLGSIVGYLSENGNMSQEDIMQFARDASKNQWSREEQLEQARKRFGDAAVEQMQAVFDSAEGIEDYYSQQGIGKLSDDKETNENIQKAAYGGAFNRGLMNYSDPNGLFAGPAKKSNLDNLTKNEKLWERFTAAGFTEDDIKAYKEDPNSVPEYKREVLERMSRFDANDEKSSSTLLGILNAQAHGTEMNYNVGGHTKSGESGNAARIKALNHPEYGDLEVDTGPNDVTAAAQAAGANTDRIGNNQVNIEAAQKAAEEMAAMQQDVERGKKVVETTDAVMDHVTKPKEEGGMGGEAFGPAIESLAGAMNKLSGLLEDYLKKGPQ